MVENCDPAKERLSIPIRPLIGKTMVDEIYTPARGPNWWIKYTPLDLLQHPSLCSRVTCSATSRQFGICDSKGSLNFSPRKSFGSSKATAGIADRKSKRMAIIKPPFQAPPARQFRGLFLSASRAV